MNKIVLIGGGGHCRSCIDVIEQGNQFEIEGIIDIKEKIGQEILGYKIFATDREIPEIAKSGFSFFITVGQIRGFQKRKEIYSFIKDSDGNLPFIISPKAYVSIHSKLGEGSIVMHHALVNAGAKIGNNCIINSKSLIEHDVNVGDHCHISTGAVLNGGVRIGDFTFVGSNASVKEQVEVGESSFIGLNSRIIKNTPPNSYIKK